MPIQRNIALFIQFVRLSKKKITKWVSIASVISIILLIAGSYYFLYHYYQLLIFRYYTSLLHEVYSFQDRIIHKESYLEDIKPIARVLKNRRGVVNVWITDRYGKCLYHTNSKLLEMYRGKRLPLSYYRNIQSMWKFKDNFPIVAVAPSESWLQQRLSIPLYAFGHDEPDFILGIEVKRFPFLPSRFEILSAWIAAWIILSFSLLFFPVWIFARKRLEEVGSQARILGGAFEMELRRTEEEEKTGGEGGEEKPKEEEMEEEKEVEPRIERVVATESEEKQKEKVVTAKKLPSQKELEKREKSDPRIQLIEIKQTLFRKESRTFEKLQIGSSVFHSKGAEGSYLFHYGTDSNSYFVSFSLSGMDLEEAVITLTEFHDMIVGQINSNKNIKEVARQCNNYCLKKKIKSDFFIIIAYPNYLEYLSLGKGYAIYLKQREESVKTLSLSISSLLGDIKSDDEFNDRVEYAEVRLEKGDRIVFLPPNYDSISIEGKLLNEYLRGLIESLRHDNLEMIQREIEKGINAVRKINKDMPETGIVYASFL